MRTLNRIVADAPGSNVPRFAVIAPVAPSPGATVVPCDEVAEAALDDVVFAGVASLITTEFTSVVPVFVTVISYRMQAFGTAPAERLSVVNGPSSVPSHPASIAWRFTIVTWLLIPVL